MENGEWKMEIVGWGMEVGVHSPPSPFPFYLPRRVKVSKMVFNKMTMSSHSDWCLM